MGERDKNYKALGFMIFLTVICAAIVIIPVYISEHRPAAPGSNPTAQEPVPVGISQSGQLAPVATAQTARQIAQNTFPSVVLLMMEDANGQPISMGSGFFVSHDVVATNLHVVERASRGYATAVGSSTPKTTVEFRVLDFRILE